VRSLVYAYSLWYSNKDSFEICSVFKIQVCSSYFWNITLNVKINTLIAIFCKILIRIEVLRRFCTGHAFYKLESPTKKKWLVNLRIWEHYKINIGYSYLLSFNIGTWLINVVFYIFSLWKWWNNNKIRVNRVLNNRIYSHTFKLGMCFRSNGTYVI